MGLFIVLSIVIGLVVGVYWGRKMTPTVSNSTPAYMVALGKNYNPEDMQPYVTALPPVYEKYQGGYMAMATNVELLEGEFDFQSILVSKWPSVEKAREFWNSEEYQEAKKLREGVGQFNIFLIKGLPENSGKTE